MQTLFRAITICVSLFVLMAGVFTRPELVLEPGMAQIGAMLLIMTATIGITFSLQARFSDRRAIDVPLRLVLAAVALVVLLHPESPGRGARLRPGRSASSATGSCDAGTFR